MFRKGLREGGGGGGGGSKGGSKHKVLAGRHQGKRSRDMGYGNADDMHSTYRTHIFFAPARGFNQDNDEGSHFSLFYT